MIIAGYIASVAIGILLGLLGGGGSILTVPVLVYLFGDSPTMATTHSLFIVGITSLAGAISYFKNGQIDLRTALIFGIPSVIAVYLTRSHLLPAIPDILIENPFLSLTKDMFLMLLFALLMLASSISMIRKNNPASTTLSVSQYRYGFIFLEGSVVGVLTGLVGAGGGFLIIPALVLFCRLPMHRAIGTSLVIIAFKSLLGMAGDTHLPDINWIFLGMVTSFSLVGMMGGILLSKKINGEKLKPAFGWFTLFMGIFIVMNEIFVK